MILTVGNDLGNGASVANPERAYAHAFIARADTAITQDAARRIKKDYRGPLLLIHVQLSLNEAALTCAVAEHHILELALAALIAHRTIQRMIGQQKLERALTRPLHDVGIGAHYHALGHRSGAAHLQLRGLLDLHQTHAARGLQR